MLIIVIPNHLPQVPLGAHLIEYADFQNYQGQPDYEEPIDNEDITGYYQEHPDEEVGLGLFQPNDEEPGFGLDSNNDDMALYNVLPILDVNVLTTNYRF